MRPAHLHTFKNHKVKPTMIVSSPGFGSISMMTALAVHHVTLRENSAAFLFTDCEPRKMLDMAPDAPVRWAKAQSAHIPSMKREIESWIHAVKEVGKSALFIGADATSMRDSAALLQMVDGLDTEGVTVSLIYIVNANPY